MSASLAPIARSSSLELLGVAAGLLGGADVGIGHDLHQRRARAVEVDQADPSAGVVGGVDELGRVLLEVGPGDPDRDLALGRLERQPAMGGERQVVLADLVALRQVRVEVVLAIPAGRRPASRRRSRRPVARTCSTARRLIDRQRARQAEADRADVAVRRRAGVVVRAAAEHLRGGLQLAVDLDPDDGLVALEGGRGPVRRWSSFASAQFRTGDARAPTAGPAWSAPATATRVPRRPPGHAAPWPGRACSPLCDEHDRACESALLTGRVMVATRA